MGNAGFISPTVLRKLYPGFQRNPGFAILRLEGGKQRAVYKSVAASQEPSLHGIVAFTDFPRVRLSCQDIRCFGSELRLPVVR